MRQGRIVIGLCLLTPGGAAPALGRPDIRVTVAGGRPSRCGLVWKKADRCPATKPCARSFSPARVALLSVN